LALCFCGAEASYKDPYVPFSHDYCPTCFTKYLEKKFLRGIPKAVRGHSIAVAVSGGKDSMALLDIFYKNRAQFRLSSLYAFILEEEIPEINQQRQRIVKFLHKYYPDLKIIYKSYSDFYQYSIPDLITISDNKGLKYTPCTICGIFRKQTLFKLSLENGVTFIALGSTLEDNASTVLLNSIRGTPERNLIQKDKFEEFLKHGFPRRIKPLTRISEDLIQKYVSLSNLPTITSRCPYSNRSLREEITSFISKLKERDPRGSFLFNLVNIQNQVTSDKRSYTPKKCNNCNMLSDQSLCPVCRILAKFRGKQQEL
jgi:uncharacterized protein (TIGR00269 family)